MKMYKEATKNFPTKTIVLRDEPVDMIDGLLVRRLNQQFDNVIIKSQPKGFDINQDKRKKGLKNKEYIHSFGPDIWKQYCEFLKKYKNA